jgi:hypothetical protein
MDLPNVDVETYGAWTDLVAKATKMALAAAMEARLAGSAV